MLFVVDASGAARPVPLHPNSPYAKVADLVSLAARGDEVVALGAAHGGAHANPRWTVWAGSPQRLDEYPQTFETFGGQSAGGLLDIVFTSDGPVIAGTWAAMEGGLDAAIWLPRGQKWIRQESAGTALANTKEIQVAPRAAKRRQLGHDHLWLRDHLRRWCGATSGSLDLADPQQRLDAAAASRRRNSQ